MAKNTELGPTGASFTRGCSVFLRKGANWPWARTCGVADVSIFVRAGWPLDFTRIGLPLLL